jgi:predicted transcriptional regulator
VSVTKDGEDEEAKKHVAETAREEKMTYPCFLDVDGAWSEKSEMAAIPVFMIVDRQGKVAYKHSGKLAEGTDSFEAMRSAIDKALERKVAN